MGFGDMRVCPKIIFEVYCSRRKVRGNGPSDGGTRDRNGNDADRLLRAGEHPLSTNATT
jgi:hypothetical protein